ncbi:MAG: baseplate J/gp47 family protein [Calothrix sp. MO_192.B10]|nr:baseplate J/gp47 family protein [Calothrix sp. MO_192.B10]
MNIRREPPKNPLIRDGVSQGQRQLPALSPDFVKIDEGDLADFLVFAYKLSQQVTYYKDDNTVDGNWQEFFTSSTPVQIALISQTRPERVKNEYRANLDKFIKNQCIVTLKPVLASWRGILKDICDWYKGLKAYTPFKSAIAGLVQTNLREALQRIQSFELIAQDSEPRELQLNTIPIIWLLLREINPLAGILFLRWELLKKFYEDFAQVFFDQPISWELEPAEILLTGTVKQARDELDVIFQVLSQNYRQIILLAPKYLRDSLEKRQDHPPHLSLYFAFWEVMRPARDDLNRMTQRHLDFFYRQVLQLRDRPAEPDHAHLIFELAKSITEYQLDEETRFLAGKDATGVELFYQLDGETVIHKAQIASLKGLFLDSQEIASGDQPNNLQGFYISPQVNSFDGEGGDFPKEQIVKAWLPFGDNTRKHGQLGLAIASNIFYLQEGNRTLVFTFTFDQAPETVKASNLADIFTIEFSGEKDWIAGEILPPQTSETSLENNILKLSVNIGAELEPIDIYHPELPGAKLPTDQPVARLQLKNDVQINGLSTYSYFRNLQLTGLTIHTKDIKVRNLVLQNDFALLDPTKPFQPFGARPKAKANLYIGSQEVLQKHLSELTIHLELEKEKPKEPKDWLDIYAAYDSASDVSNPDQVTLSSDFNPGQLAIASLRKRIWNPTNDKPTRNLFSGSEISLTDELANLKLNSFADTETVEAFTPDSQNGFLRLQLTGSDFLHDEYPTVVARQVLAAATNQKINVDNLGEKRQAVIGAYYKKDGVIFKVTSSRYYVEFSDEAIIPKEPYTPVIQEIYLQYTAVAEKKDCKLFHLHPFEGFAAWDEQKPYFLPQFTNEGELLIGLENLEPPTALPLLFQVVEESADGELEKAELEWYYLQDNTWISLSDRIISDSTNGLIASGIINVPIPQEISKLKTTILDPNFYWIKASVKSRSRAVCQIIGVHTQAARVTFVNTGNDPNHLATPLESGTIAKLAVPTAAIKKIEQPYNSFGGKVKEQPSHFYTRISEHLRHKGRAVTIFDYERLVLEKFPEIYKVRCINHGRLGEDQQFQELVPGTVTLVVIPKLSPDRISQELEPKVNIQERETIQEYLLTLSSPWADIQVVNPKYEHIQVEFAVRFKSPYNANFGYYRRELQQGITNFLTPWTVDPQAEINFGGTVYRSSILNFVEQQYYVEYVVDFKMHHKNQRDVREAIASTARSILTSVSLTSTNQTHIIQSAPEVSENQKLASGILGYKALADIILQPEEGE